MLKKDSPAGNRTRVSRVTGGDTYHYTTEDLKFDKIISIVLQTLTILISSIVRKDNKKNNPIQKKIILIISHVRLNQTFQLNFISVRN
jgi:hypothetical protein